MRYEINVNDQITKKLKEINDQLEKIIRKRVLNKIFIRSFQEILDKVEIIQNQIKSDMLAKFYLPITDGEIHYNGGLNHRLSYLFEIVSENEYEHDQLEEEFEEIQDIAHKLKRLITQTIEEREITVQSEQMTTLKKALKSTHEQPTLNRPKKLAQKPISTQRQKKTDSTDLIHINLIYAKFDATKSEALLFFIGLVSGILFGIFIGLGIKPLFV